MAATPTADRSAPQKIGEVVLSCQGLTKIYRSGETEVVALRGVDLEVSAHEVVVLLGASGSGKSTLLNIIGGLDTPTEGRLRFRDLELSDGGDGKLTRYRRQHVGFVFQFYNLMPSLTARANVALVTEIADNPMDPADALALVDLSDRLDHFPAQMSGGEQQRVAIARAIAKRPDILLCDEPTGALDSRTGILVLEAIERVNRETGAATMIITHNAVISGMADRTIQLADGAVRSIEHNPERRDPATFDW